MRGGGGYPMWGEDTHLGTTWNQSLGILWDTYGGTEAAAQGPRPTGRYQNRVLPPPFALLTGPPTHTEWNCRSVARWGHREHCFLMPVQLGGSNWEGAGTRASSPGCWLAEASDSGGRPICERMGEPQRSGHSGPRPPPLLWAGGAQSRNWSWLHGLDSRGAVVGRGGGPGPPSGLLPNPGEGGHS